MRNESSARRTVQIAPVRKNVRVNASAEHAFSAFTKGFNLWWPRSHHIAKVEMAEAIIEPFAGGRWYERGEDGSECEWGKVLVWEPPGRLILAWQINAQFAYDASLVTEVEVRFIEENAKLTRVELEHRDLERLGDEGHAFRAQIDSSGGWGHIMDLYAKQAGRAA